MTMGWKLSGLLITTIIAVVQSLPSEMKSRSPPSPEDDKRITDNRLYGLHSTSSDLLDVRTPPRVREQQKQILKHKEEFENSHAGVAFPVDENIIMSTILPTMKNDQGIRQSTSMDSDDRSSWILLTDLSTTTSIPSKRIHTTPTLKITEVKRVTNPYFKKRNNTSEKHRVHLTENSSLKVKQDVSDKPFQKVLETEIPTIKLNKTVTSLTKIKASELSQAVIQKNSSRYVSKNHSAIETIPQKLKKEPHIVSSSVRTTTKNTTHQIVVDSDKTNITQPLAEAKDVETDLVAPTKKRKNSVKRKKNKNHRKKPSETEVGATTVTKPAKLNKDKPISTQIYSYLSREVMPTVGVGLVGLMVTAGLASYFFYPFGIARRSYAEDRKDYDEAYDYRKGLSVPEEEAIGKVISGMSTDTFYSGNLQQPNNKQNANIKYRLADNKPQVGKRVHGSVEDVPLAYDNEDAGNNFPSAYQTIDYSTNSNENELFITGSEKTKNIVTPVTVPEHGPRDLKVENGKDEREVTGTDGIKSDALFGPRYLVDE